MANKSDLNSIKENEEKCVDEELQNGNIVITVDKTDRQITNPHIDEVKQNGDNNYNSQANGNTNDEVDNGGIFQIRNGKSPINVERNGKIDVSKSLLEIPLNKNGHNGHRMSFMEEESAKEKLRLALLKQCAAILKQGDQRYTKESLHRTFQDVDLLERIYRLFDAEGQGFVAQDDWFEFLKQRTTDQKQLDFVETAESVAYVLCGDDVITSDAFQHILQNRVVTNKLFRVLDAGDGSTTADAVMEFISTLSSSRPRVGFDKSSVDRLEALFKKTVGDQQEITQEQFQKIMESKNPFFTERVFQIFDEDHNGAISLREFIAAVHEFAGHTPDDKIRFLFKVYDMDNDGLIQHRELQHVMRVCMEENGMQFSEEQLLELTGSMMEDADTDNRGAITYDAFRRMLEIHGGLLENITTSIDRWLVPPKVDCEPTSALQKLAKLKPYQLSLPYLRNNYALVSYLAVYSLLNLVLFVTRCYQYRESNGFVIVARGCGQCLNFNCAWVLVLMLRHCVTALRVRGLGVALPLDHHVYLHKVTGVLIAVYSVAHTVMHLCNFSVLVVVDPVTNHGNYTLSEWLLTSRPGLFGLVAGWANPTGVGLVFVLAIMVLCSQSFVRRRGSFKVFYWSHLLYVPFWVLLLLHGPSFYLWFLLPGALYLAERVMRYVWMMSERSKTYVSSGVLLPSRVTHLVVRRPPHFTFRAGDYVFLNIPQIAFAEWHPFTISSAPELDDYIWLHIRAVGEWTGRLRAYFEAEQLRLAAPPAPLAPPHPGHGHDKLRRSSSNQSTVSAVSALSRLKFGSSRKDPVSEAKYVNHGFESHEHLAPAPVRPLGSAHLAPAPVPSPQRLLEKSRSMPDVQRRTNKIALRDFLRSESERSFDPQKPSLHPPSTADLYKSPQHRELEQRFRYMRTKPPIIAFKTPSFEEHERRRSNESIITLARRRLSKTISPDKDVESIKEKMAEADTNGTEELAIGNLTVGKPLEIYIDGPYGAPSSHIFSASHAALIAAGIGVTPFASILQAVMYRYKRARRHCPSCHHHWTDTLHDHDMRLKKVDFFWLNREQRSFEWFVSLLSALEMEQAEMQGRTQDDQDRFLEMHMYITSALQRSDMKAVGLQLALDLLHEKEKRDLITGLKTRTNAGRPNWDKVFKRLQEQNKGKVTVFFCGPPQLARTLKVKCGQYGFDFRKEVF